jgi:hypothetical protein
MSYRLGAFDCEHCGAHYTPPARTVRRADTPWEEPARATPVTEWERSTPHVQAALGEGSARTELPKLLRPAVRPRVVEVTDSRLQVEKLVFLLAHFIIYAWGLNFNLHLDGANPDLTFLSVLPFALCVTLIPAFFLYFPNASLKNGCMITLALMVIASVWLLYIAVQHGVPGRTYGLMGQLVLYGWLISILYRENSIE